MGKKSPETDLTAYTIGHSNHPLGALLGLLKERGIEVVVDVRSSPYSGYASHFNREAFEKSLLAQGIRYLFLGNAVGGLPQEEEFYDDEGHVLYYRVAQSAGFQRGVDRILKGIQTCRVALLCGEEDPAYCHRRLLVGRVLRERGVRVLHIRGDGRVQTEEEVAREEEFRKNKGQMSLFGGQEAEEWKSTRSVSQRKARRSSSGR